MGVAVFPAAFRVTGKDGFFAEPHYQNGQGLCFGPHGSGFQAIISAALEETDGSFKKRVHVF